MADEEISRIMSLVSLTGQEPLTSLAGKLREDSALSKESTLLCVGELIHRMNETLPEDKRIHDNHYYVTAREVSQQLDSMDTTHPIGRMFVGSAKNLNDAGNILIDVILQYKVESMREIPSQVTNLFVKEHAIFKSNCDELKNISPAFGVMACLADIITVKDSMRVLAAGEVCMSSFMTAECWLTESRAGLRFGGGEAPQGAQRAQPVHARRRRQRHPQGSSRASG